MSHYWTGDDPIEARREQVRDWIEDLVEYGPAIVAEACGEWRRAQTRRPTPADIRRLCIEAEQLQRDRRALRALPSPDDPQLADAREEDRRQRRARDDHARLAREQMAVDLGYPSFSYMLSIGLLNAYRNEPGRKAAAGATAAELGVTAREYSPTPEQLRAGRIALRIEAAETE